MLNYANEMTREDLSRSFGETYCRAIVEGVDKAVRIVGFNSPTEAVVVPIEAGNRGSVINTQDIDFSMPDLGMVRVGEATYYVARAATRQWRRGLRQQGLVMYKLEPSGRVARTNMESRLFTAVARKVLLPQPPHDTIIDSNYARVGKWMFFRNLPIGTVEGSIVTSSGITVKLPEGYRYADS